MDKESLKEFIKEYLAESLKIKIYTRDVAYCDEIEIKAIILLDGEQIAEGSDTLSYSMIGKESYSDDY